MTEHVLVPIDGSSPSWAALEHAFTEHEGKRITALHVVDPTEGVYADIDGGYYDRAAYDAAVERGDSLCEEVIQRAEESGVQETTVLDCTVETGRPSRTIVDYADEHDVDHVVIGSHGRSGVSRILLGSVAETVVRRANVPVTVVR